MQNSSAFQYVAMDQIHESKTNPRQTFEQDKLEELAESIRQHGLIQPITVRPNSDGFEIVAGARRFRASQLAELFSVPARIVELDDAKAIEWQLVENSQRVDVHPFEEAQGFHRLLDFPGYDVPALVLKSGKSASHIYSRLSLLQLIPTVSEAFVADRITSSHAALIARLPQEHQTAAFEACWRKDWQDKEPHLLPAKHLSAWVQTNLYLALADAPFDREDPTLNTAAGACTTCPRRSGFNTSLFCDVQGDQCLDATCYQHKTEAHIDRELAARPQLVKIETTWRHPKEQRQGALQKHQYRELDGPINEDAEPACDHTKPAIVVFGKQVGRTFTVCTNPQCDVHDPRATVPTPPVPEQLNEPEEEETPEQRGQREAERDAYLQQQNEEAEQRRKEFQQQQEELEARRAALEKKQKQRAILLERIIEHAPTTFSQAQLRVILRALVNVDPYNYIDCIASSLSNANETTDLSAEEIVTAAIDASSDDGLTAIALRLALADHVGLPNEGQHDFITEAATAFLPLTQQKKTPSKRPVLVKATSKKASTRKKVA